MPSRSRSPSSEPPNEPPSVDIYWKRRCLDMEQKLKKSEQKRKREEPEASVKQLGRGIPKLASLFLEVDEIVQHYDKHELLLLDELEESKFAGMNNEAVEKLKRDHMVFKEIARLVPNFKKTVDKSSPAALKSLYAEVNGALDTRGDDVSKLMHQVTHWFNTALPETRPLLDPLLCPIKYNWDDEEVRAKLRAAAPGYNYNDNFLLLCLFHNTKGLDEELRGFLRSPLLVKVFKFIFTAPTSSQLVDLTASSSNEIPQANKTVQHSRNSKGPGGNKSIASILNIKAVTLRSLAYAATQLVLALSSAPKWTIKHSGFNFQSFYKFIINYLEDFQGNREHCKKVEDLLLWWNKQVFPHVVPSTECDVRVNSMKALEELGM
ncbi:unnamed protein product [Cyclocybe aegerita]|uniref:Uncharacterized protein n=1 Tax=Cyclocybe aegerita TaxID=1973307 RepID=A0A8S0WIH3_CYCAE|nr:unnamed protein product [Cyclocybe aegerita]